ncbi:MAG: hypothetical protein IJZ95_04240 [Oscillospiraceae bacterium]|nr:hypothetical protein [Oscillospiraceae bacterium]
MIISENRKPPLEAFRELMSKTDETLNAESAGKEKYYSGRNGTQLEEDVCDALTRCAVNTPFEGTIQLVSGASFPDIVASKYYGVEVKSTNKNHWKSIGSSILESTRNQSVERIFLTFGKLGAPIAFKSRPYEECLSGISVTHYPRYQIDMELGVGETIFDKMGVPYDTLRKMDNPVAPVSQYYKKKLKPGESLWWAADADVEETVAPPTVKLWSALTPEEKNIYTVKGYALFPEILTPNSTKKYQRYALWLATHCGIINTNIRDQFSAGGRVDIITDKGVYEKMPAAFGRIVKYKDLIIDTLITENSELLKEYWELLDSVPENRILYWCQLAALSAGKSSKDNCNDMYCMLRTIFNV